MYWPPRGWIKCLKYLNCLHCHKCLAISFLKIKRISFCAGTSPSETRTDNPYLCRNGILSSSWLQCTTSPLGKEKKNPRVLSVLFAKLWSLHIKSFYSKTPSEFLGNIFEWLSRWHARQTFGFGCRQGPQLDDQSQRLLPLAPRLILVTQGLCHSRKFMAGLNFF